MCFLGDYTLALCKRKKKVTGTCYLGVEKPTEFRFEYGYDHTFGKLVNDMIW